MLGMVGALNNWSTRIELSFEDESRANRIKLPWDLASNQGEIGTLNFFPWMHLLFFLRNQKNNGTEQD